MNQQSRRIVIIVVVVVVVLGCLCICCGAVGVGGLEIYSSRLLTGTPADAATYPDGTPTPLEPTDAQGGEPTLAPTP